VISSQATSESIKFRLGYRGRAGDYQRLMARQSRILPEGWLYP
jgi:hypothetical protein